MKPCFEQDFLRRGFWKLVLSAMERSAPCLKRTEQSESSARDLLKLTANHLAVQKHPFSAITLIKEIASRKIEYVVC